VRVDEKQVLKTIVEALEDGKAESVVVLDLAHLTTMTDYFVIAHGVNTRQVQALAKAVEERLREACQLRPHHLEGFSAGQWVLMDYGFVIVHLFLEDRRGYYSLERIWMDAPRVRS
jgi:ribosome-associated protein